MKILRTLAVTYFAAAIILLMCYQVAYGKSQNFADFKEDLNIIAANEGTDNYTPIQEDQFIVCNMWKVCQVIDADDYMSRDESGAIWNNFDKELDTFDIKDIAN